MTKIRSDVPTDWRFGITSAGPIIFRDIESAGNPLSFLVEQGTPAGTFFFAQRRLHHLRPLRKRGRAGPGDRTGPQQQRRNPRRRAREIPKPLYDELIDAVATNEGYRPEIRNPDFDRTQPEGEGNRRTLSLTKEQFFRRWFRDLLKQHLRRHRSQAAEAQARKAASDQVDGTTESLARQRRRNGVR